MFATGTASPTTVTVTVDPQALLAAGSAVVTLRGDGETQVDLTWEAPVVPAVLPSVPVPAPTVSLPG